MRTISEQVNEIRAMRSPRPDGEPPNPFEFEQVRPAAAGVPGGAHTMRSELAKIIAALEVL